MPKPYTAPFLIDQQKTLKVGYLSKNGYFKANHSVTGATGWTSNKSKDLDILITSMMEKENERIILSYTDFNQQQTKQTIYLTSRPSNLCKGLIWFFICPFTLTVCRNLIFAQGKFMHRSSLSEAMYTIQAESHYWRKMFKLQPNIPTTLRILAEPNAKHYKKMYNKKITKRYKKYLTTLQSWDANRIERNALINNH